MNDALIHAAGLGLRTPHREIFLRGEAGVAWSEVHAENYMCAGGARLKELEGVRRHCELSLHGVGLSLGSAHGLDEVHLRGIKALAARVAPVLVSDHLAWCVNGGVYFADLLPLPYSEEALAAVIANVAHAQEVLGRAILVENPSLYVAFAESVIPEAEFLNALADATGCGLLIDLNNIHVSSRNLGGSARAYLDKIVPRHVWEYHLAGHARTVVDGEEMLIDDHGARVDDEVWALYDAALKTIGPRPTLIEWDSNIPPFATLAGEARKAQRRLDAVSMRAEACRHAG